MKKRYILSCVFCACLAGSSVHAAMDLDESLKVLEGIMNNKNNPIVAANVVFGCDCLNSVMEKFNKMIEAVNGFPVTDEQKEILMGKIALKCGAELTEGTKEFFDALYQFNHIIKPVVIDGLKDQPENIVENSMLIGFLDGKKDEIKEKIKTYDGLFQVDIELRALFSYLQDKFPDGYALGVAYLKKLQGIEDGENNSEQGQSEEEKSE